MEFNQIEDTPERKRWLSACGNYRITHINMLPNCPKYKAPWYAEVLQLVNSNAVWSHAHRHGPWWSYKAAEKACRSNRHKWKRFMRCENAEQAREMIDKSKVGVNKFGKRTKYACKILTTPPKWIEERMPKRLRRLLPGYGKPHMRKKAVSDIRDRATTGISRNYSSGRRTESTSDANRKADTFASRRSHSPLYVA